MLLYLAGPMRGHPYFNAPAFDDAAHRLRAAQYQVLSPVEMDRADGFVFEDHPSGDLAQVPTGLFDHHAALLRDVRAILQADALCLLPGWETSVGATAERAVAHWAGKPVRHLQALLA